MSTPREYLKGATIIKIRGGIEGDVGVESGSGVEVGMGCVVSGEEGGTFQLTPQVGSQMEGQGVGGA